MAVNIKSLRIKNIIEGKYLLEMKMRKKISIDIMKMKNLSN